MILGHDAVLAVWCMTGPLGIPLRKIDMKFCENRVPGSRVDIVRGRMVRLSLVRVVQG